MKIKIIVISGIFIAGTNPQQNFLCKYGFKLIEISHYFFYSNNLGIF